MRPSKALPLQPLTLPVVKRNERGELVVNMVKKSQSPTETAVTSPQLSSHRDQSAPFAHQAPLIHQDDFFSFCGAQVLITAMRFQNEGPPGAYAHFEQSPGARPANVYSLCEVESASGKSFTVSAEAVTRTSNGITEYWPLLQWVKEAHAYSQIGELPFFVNFRPWKAISLLKQHARNCRIGKTALRARLLSLDSQLRPSIIELGNVCYDLCQNAAACVRKRKHSILFRDTETDLYLESFDTVKALMDLPPTFLSRACQSIESAYSNALADSGAELIKHYRRKPPEVKPNITSCDRLRVQSEAHDRTSRVLKLSDMMLRRALHEVVFRAISLIWRGPVIRCIDPLAIKEYLSTNPCALQDNHLLIPAEDDLEDEFNPASVAEAERSRLEGLNAVIYRAAEAIVSRPPSFISHLEYSPHGHELAIDPPCCVRLESLKSREIAVVSELENFPLPSKSQSLAHLHLPLFAHTPSRVRGSLDSDDEIIEDDVDGESKSDTEVSATLSIDTGFTTSEKSELAELRRFTSLNIETAYECARTYIAELRSYVGINESVIALRACFDQAESLDLELDNWSVRRINKTLQVLDAQELLICSTADSIRFGALEVRLESLKETLLPHITSCRSAIMIEVPVMIRHLAETMQNVLEVMLKSIPTSVHESLRLHVSAICWMQLELSPQLEAVQRDISRLMEFMSLAHERDLAGALGSGTKETLRKLPRLLCKLQWSLLKN